MSISLSRSSEPVVQRAVRAGASSRRRHRALTGILLISPWLLGFVLFKALPILASLFFSFTNFDLLNPQETRVVGLLNYARLLTDREAGTSFFSNVSLAIITIPLQIGTSLGLAALLNSERLRARSLLRTLFFLPSIIPGVAIFFVWSGFLDPTNGWLNQIILSPLGLPPLGPVNGEAGYNMLMGVLALWSIGPGLYIMLGAMQNVPQDLYESARVDGAGPALRFFAITLPLVSPAIFFSLVINLIGVFGGVALLDRGTPFSGTISSFDGYIYDVLFHEGNMGYAASLSWVFFLMMIVVTVLLFRSARQWVFYMEGEGD